MNDDLISRQAAIDTVCECECGYPHDECPITYPHDGTEWCAVVGALKDLPSAQLKGKWKVITNNRGRHAECPFCGEWKYHNKQKFCGECGAELKGEEDG